MGASLFRGQMKKKRHRAALLSVMPFFFLLFWFLKLINTLLNNRFRLTLAGLKTEYQDALGSRRISGVIMRLFQFSLAEL